MKYAIRHLYIALAALLAAGCSEALDVVPESGMELRFSVNEAAWGGQAVSMTRSDETLLELQDKDNGFGVFCDALSMKNIHVTWNSEKGKWEYGYKMLWPENKVPVGEGFQLLAYAPYEENKTLLPDTSDTPDAPDTSAKSNSIAFDCAADNDKDLLWAQNKVNANGIIDLYFQHALAKLSFGSIINTYGDAIRLMSVTISGLFYPKGSFSLANGEWTVSEQDRVNRTYKKTYKTIVKTGETIEGDPLTEKIDGILIENGDAILLDIAEDKKIDDVAVGDSIMADEDTIDETTGDKIIKDILQIPGPKVTPEATVTPEAKVIVTIAIRTRYGDKKMTREVKLEQGKNKEINLTIGQNHEVVIK